ncbi:MAG: hypothetical protein KKB31_05655 [Nanoarchaeota archaeon]|nr:hypothetical protein [Nanoarchaeota archaeon]
MNLVKADLHNHLKTGGFFPKKIDTNKIIDQARARLGKNGVLGVVNYEPSRRYEDLAQEGTYQREDLGNSLWFSDKKILVVRGEEIETNLPNGQMIEVLALGLDGSEGNISHGRSLEYTLQAVKERGGIVGADHPFHHGGIGNYLLDNPELLRKLDFIETHNGEAAIWLPGVTQIGVNRRAWNLFRWAVHTYPHLELGSLVSSDGHSKFEIGSSYTTIPEIDRRDAPTITESLRRGLIIAGKKHLPVRRSDSYFGAMKHIAEWVAVKKLHWKPGVL